MAKKNGPRTFYQFDKVGVFTGPIEAEECPANATDKTPNLSGDETLSNVLVDGSWKLIPNADIIKATEVRTMRDQLLRESDYTQLMDFAGDAEAYKNYRDELREVPKQKGFPQAVEWPVLKPTPPKK